MSSKHFFESVWAMVAHIPEGKVATYGQIAAMLGNPRAARTVGWAMHATRNRDIPWQRVVNAKGRISTDCGEHSPDLQRLLLESEEIHFDGHDRINLQRFQWRPSLEQIEAILAKSREIKE